MKRSEENSNSRERKKPGRSKQDKGNRKNSMRDRKLQLAIDTMKAKDDQTDRMDKLVKGFIYKHVAAVIKHIIKYIGMAWFASLLLIVVIALPVILAVIIIYNSPLALYAPPLESGDTVMSVTSQYEATFNDEVNQLVTNHDGCDEGVVVYIDYEGMSTTPSNYYDIMAVYMVKYGAGNTATIMNDRSRSEIKEVFDDMCHYTKITETRTLEDEEGTTSSTMVLCVNVTLKSYREMISAYKFNSDEVKLLNIIMDPANLAMIGYEGSATDSTGGNVTSELSKEEIEEIVSEITDTQAKQTCRYALSKVGYPYSQAYRDGGNYYDCSSLAYYSWKAAGVNISYGGATTAAAEGQGLDEDGKIVCYEEIQPGDLIFYSYCSNGRYKNISHVAIYVGNGKAVEALNERVGVVYRDISTGSIVMIGRP